MQTSQCKRQTLKPETKHQKSYLSAKTAFHVAEFIGYDSFFLIGSFPGQLDAGISKSPNLKFGWLTWNWKK